jgi:O-antigen/teichoic acid export membrane protein
MNDTRKTIAKNASFLMISQIATWSMAILLMVFLPRYLGAEGVGQIHLANSIWAILSVFVSFGMGIMLTKEIARSRDRFSELAGTSLVIRIVFYMIALVFLAIYLKWANYSSQTTWVIIIFGVATFINVCSTTFVSSLEGTERMGYIAISDISNKLFTTVVTLILLFMGKGILLIASVAIGGSIISFVIQVSAVHKILPIKLNFRWDLVSWILKAGTPFFLVAVFQTIYIQIDIIIISLIVDETVLGWYGVADTLFSTLLFIPSIFLIAAFPALSRLYVQKSDALVTLMRKSFDMLLLISVPMGLGLFVLGTPIVVLLYGDDFKNSGTVLSVMGIVLIFTYLNMLVGKFLISMDLQNKFTVVMAIAMIVSIPLDLILVPWCQQIFGNGAIGGALSFVLTEFGMLVFAIFLLPKGSLGSSNIWVGGRIFLAGIIMAVVVAQIRDLFIAIPIFVGILTYTGLVILFRVLPKEDISLFQDMGKTILLKFRRVKAPVS